MREFFVPGKPIGQGRISTINNHSFHSNAKELIPWRDSVAWCAKAAKIPLLDGPVQVSYLFVLPKPKTVKRDFPHVVPDLDHLIRAIGDSLKGIAFFDDSQICRFLEINKVYGERIGAQIAIGILDRDVRRCKVE